MRVIGHHHLSLKIDPREAYCTVYRVVIWMVLCCGERVRTTSEWGDPRITTQVRSELRWLKLPYIFQKQQTQRYLDFFAVHLSCFPSLNCQRLKPIPYSALHGICGPFFFFIIVQDYFVLFCSELFLSFFFFRLCPQLQRILITGLQPYNWSSNTFNME